MKISKVLDIHNDLVTLWGGPNSKLRYYELNRKVSYSNPAVSVSNLPN